MVDVFCHVSECYVDDVTLSSVYIITENIKTNIFEFSYCVKENKTLFVINLLWFSFYFSIFTFIFYTLKNVDNVTSRSFFFSDWALKISM